ncbi:MAG: FG-GAP-like repeat-containing protein, partial [Planctomycetes bacterium]|nr:FG-GAP-like repeat-containing protein [Planctomycetota bacterium]
MSRGARSFLVAVSLGLAFITFGLVPRCYAANDVDVPSDPMAWYAFDDESTTVATDISGSGYDGAVLGATWTTGVSGGALDFDGIDDRVSLGALDVAANAISINAWVRSDNLRNCSEGDCRIVSKATDVQAADHYWMLSTVDDGALRFRLKTDDDTSTIAGGRVSNGVWTHVVATYDGATMRLYQDGVAVASAPKAGWLTPGPEVEVWIGDNPPSQGSRPWDGAIDDVRIYDRALSDAEVEQLYAEPTAQVAADEQRATIFEMAEPQVIESNAMHWWATALGDFNGDGLVDFAVIDDNAYGGWLGWYETSSDMTTWTAHIIAYTAPDGGEFAAGDLEAMDVDNDGDLDIIGFSHPGEWSEGARGTKVYWYENPSWAPHYIADMGAFIKDVEGADFNNDGKMDLALLSHSGNRFTVFRQDEPDSWTRVQEITIW